MIRRELSPAAAGSVLLHAGVAAALLISWPWTRDLKVGAVVPVTIVANAPQTDLRAAEQAPVEQTAQTELPVPDAPLESAPPEPTPAPPTPAPIAKTTPAKPAEKAAPQKAQTKPAEKGLDFDALLASIPKSKSAPAKPSSAPKGASRPETAQQARPNLGSGLSAAQAMTGLADELQRRWNPNCEVEGGRDVIVRVTFALGAGGQLVGEPAAEIRGARNAVAQAAADRAIRAVYAASPFRNLPREFHGQRVAVNFNAREACKL